ncbi:MAG TPA: type II secretion system F family protein [Kribbella sp.]|uniref:type II secretion system F family protein n=1 Tax=Kribbella sp. TaxID=1871183 RepID=UPI002D765339|nr:type II secretion system F family protein [Kribbella sp.]HET6296831.1 type II secretion system F family protein [Kribbella sp.]
MKSVFAGGDTPPLIAGSEAPALIAGLMIFVVAVALLPRRGRGLHRLAAAAGDARRRTTLVRSGSRRTAGADAALARSAGRLPSSGAGDLARSAGRRLAMLASLVIVAVVVALSLSPQLVVSVLAVGLIVAVVVHQRVRSRRRRDAASRRSRIIEACDVLAAELAAGRPPRDALEGAATICPELQVASAAARLGGDVPAVLELATEPPGAEGLRALAAAWRVADESGAAFAAIVERLAEALRAEESVRRQISTNLASTRATARLLAVLPLFGTGLGYALGADPLAFLTSTPPGWLCLFLGLSLAIAGLLWTDRLASTPND